MKLSFAFLLMLSNVSATDLLTTSTEQQRNAEISSLMQLKFPTSMPDAWAEAVEVAHTMDMEVAMKKVHHFKNSRHATALLQMGNNASNGVDVHKNQYIQSKLQGKMFDQAMAFINTDIVVQRELLDDQLFMCGVYKEQTDPEIARLQSELTRIAAAQSEVMKSIEKSKAEIKQYNEEMTEQKMLQDAERKVCATNIGILTQTVAELQQEYDVISLIYDTAKDECAVTATPFLIQACTSGTGKTYFKVDDKLEKHASKLGSSKAIQAFQQMLFEAYSDSNGPLQGLDLAGLISDGDSKDYDGYFEGGASFLQIKSRGSSVAGAPAPATPTAKEPAGKYQNNQCPLGVKPKCGDLLDKIGTMKSEKGQELDTEKEALAKEQNRCEIEDARYNEIIQNYDAAVRKSTATLLEDTAEEQSLEEDMRVETANFDDLCHAYRDKFTECHEQMTTILGQLCGLIKIRQAVYNKIKVPAEPVIIEDCTAGEWVIGECSATCHDALGNAGYQKITRGLLQVPDKTTDAGKYGTACPILVISERCAEEACPIDCQVTDWQGWSKCSAPCGGGNEGRSRQIDRQPDHGGAECPILEQEQQCNTDSCDQDCELGDWSHWGACNKACTYEGVSPGIQERRKGIKRAASGQGKCPRPSQRTRYETQQCNKQECPASIECVAEMDIVLLLDSSGSLRNRRKPYDKNWKENLMFAQKLIENSKMATTDADGLAKGGTRFGLVPFSSRPTITMQLSNEKDKLLTAVKGMKWVQRGTRTDLAIDKAISIFGMSAQTERTQVTMLVTDGLASWPYGAYRAALRLRGKGAKLYIVPVGRAAARYEKFMCYWVSKPCKQFMLKIANFDELTAKLNWFMSSFCPILAMPTTTTAAPAAR